MTLHSRQNAITQRLEKLTLQWSDFSTLPSFRVLRWLIQYDELRMMDAFFEVESSEHGSTPDLFLRFDTPFKNPATYAADLNKQLVEVVENDRPFLEEDEVFLNWKPASLSFFKNISSFAKSLEDFEGHLVVFLQPENLESSNTKNFNEWLSQAIEASIPDNVRILLIDVIDFPIFEKTALTFPDQVKTLEPRLDMPAAIQQLAAAGDPNDPGVQFRKVFVEMSLKASKGQMNELEQLSEKALDIAKVEGWDHLQIAVHNLVGTSWLNKNQFVHALSRFGRAEKIAQSAYQKENPEGAKLLIQVLFFEGAAYFSKKDFINSGEKYFEAIPIAEASEDHFYLMEAHRMLGNCYELCKENRLALESNKKALIAAESVDEQIRLNSTIPYIGVSALKLLRELSLNNEIPLLRKKMQQLLGDQDWESIPKSKPSKQ